MDAPVKSSRRAFLITTGVVAGGLLIGFAMPPLLRRMRGAADSNAEFKPNAFLRIGADGAITITVGMSEMGQGVLTALPMLVAEELDADWSRVRFEQAAVHDDFKNPMLGMQATGGSMSTRAHWEPLRRVGATARAMLVAAAADQWDADPAMLRTENSSVIHSDGRKLDYGQLAARAALAKVPEKVALKDPKDFKLLGTSPARLDLAGKVNGTAQFGIDVRVPGMLTAVVSRAPVLGAKVASFNADKALAVPGVRKVVQIDSGIAVVADGYWAAKTGREALEVTWTDSPNATLSSAEISRRMAELAGSKGMVAKNTGDTGKAKVARRLSAVYEAPYLAHACMEPLNCTAWVKADGVEIWAPTQAPGLNRTVLAGVAGVQPEQVQVHVTMLGGGFGRKFAQDFPIDATQISKAVQAPVQLIYSREDDMRAQHYRPAARMEFHAGLDSVGNPVALDAHAVASSVFASAGFAKPGELDSAATEGIVAQPYDVPNLHVEWSDIDPGVKVWFWRSVGNSQNVFFLESFIDELAHAAGKDPFQYRRALLSQSPRHLKVLEAAAEKAGWGTPLPKGRARGIAVAESFGSYVAEVAEVSLNDDGTPRVHRVVCAVDCGLTANPAIIERQIQSAVMYGLSAALYGKITVKDGTIEQSNFHDYQVVRLSEAPVVEVHILPSTENPGGVGEPGTPPIAPAVANALFALNGKRVRKLPLNG